MKVYYQDNKFYMNDNGYIVNLTPNEDNYLRLPTNSCNRVWVSCNKVLAQSNQTLDYGDTVKVARVLGPQQHKDRKKDIEYLSEADQKLFKELLEKIKKAKAEARKPDPLAKAKAKAEKAKAEYEALKAQMKEAK